MIRWWWAIGDGDYVFERKTLFLSAFLFENSKTRKENYRFTWIWLTAVDEFFSFQPAQFLFSTFRPIFSAPVQKCTFYLRRFYIVSVFP